MTRGDNDMKRRQTPSTVSPQKKNSQKRVDDDWILSLTIINPQREKKRKKKRGGGKNHRRTGCTQGAWTRTPIHSQVDRGPRTGLPTHPALAPRVITAGSGFSLSSLFWRWCQCGPADRQTVRSVSYLNPLTPHHPPHLGGEGGGTGSDCPREPDVLGEGLFKTLPPLLQPTRWASANQLG